jgi:hypothetical protein
MRRATHYGIAVDLRPFVALFEIIDCERATDSAV